MDTARLFNGLRLETRLLDPQSIETATTLRNNPASYSVEITVRVEVPTPAQSAEALARLNPKLPHLFTDFDLLMEGARVSPNFAAFYERKIRWIQPRLARLDSILSRDNFYDCETILQWRHPESGRRALLLQGNMDVNTDGSDGDRNVGLDYSSFTYQPQTSYRWKKATKRPNPMLASTEKALADAKKELAGKPAAARVSELNERIKRLTSTIYELKHYSFLVSTVDPFIVIPLSMVQKEAADRVGIGDYALVIHDKTFYPAIVGDAGPTFKFGEASLRICQQINPQSTGRNRPVSALTISYLVFPGTAERPFAVPDLEHWKSRCEELLTEIGGTPAEIYAWPNLVKPWPTPTPSPTPSPTPTPTPTPTADALPKPAGSDSLSPASSPQGPEKITPENVPWVSPSPETTPEG